MFQFNHGFAALKYIGRHKLETMGNNAMRGNSTNQNSKMGELGASLTFTRNITAREIKHAECARSQKTYIKIRICVKPSYGINLRECLKSPISETEQLRGGVQSWGDGIVGIGGSPEPNFTSVRNL